MPHSRGLALLLSTSLALFFSVSAIPLQSPAIPSASADDPHDAIILPQPLPPLPPAEGANDTSIALYNDDARVGRLNVSDLVRALDPVPSLDGNSTSELETVNATEAATLPKLMQKAPSVRLLPPPTISESSFCKKRSVALFWSYPDDQPEPDHYLLYKRNNYNPNATWKVVPYIEQVTVHELALSDLSPNTPYSFAIEAMFGSGRRSALSAPFNCSTMIDTPVKNPDFISAYSLNNEPVTSILVKWRPLELSERGASGASYVVAIRKASNIGSDLIEPGQSHLVDQAILVRRDIGDPNLGEAKITDRRLLPSEEYEVTVEARNPIGTSKAPLRRHKVNFRESKPSAVPQKFAVSEIIDGQSAVFSWEPVPIESVNGNFKGTFLRFVGFC